MATIPRDFVNDLNARTNIVDVISPVVPLKKAGKEYKACCPFHKEKTPSFTVNVEKNFYHCFGCQKSGDAIQFLMDYHKYSYVEAVTELAKQQGLTVPVIESLQPKENLTPLYDLLELASKFFYEQLHSHPAAATAQQYCRKRGLSHDVIEQFAIGFAPPGWDNLLQHAIGHQYTLAQCVKAGLAIQKTEGKAYDRFRHRLMFPIRDQRGRVIAFGGRIIDPNDSPKYLNSPETPLFHKGQELYGLWEAGRASTIKGIILVEGYMDVVALAQYGIPGSVATLGTATTTHHIEKCFRYAKQLFFCFDGDTAGKKAGWRALEIALPLLKQGHAIRFLFLPQDDDPDTFIRKLGTEAFVQRLEHATPLPDFFFAHLMQDLDLHQLDHKAQLANRASPLIQQIPDTILKELMFKTLSAHVQLPLQVLKEIRDDNFHTPTAAPISNSKIQIHAPRFAWQRSTLQKQPSLIRLLISLLMQTPALIAQVPDLTTFKHSSLAGMPLFIALCDFIRQRQVNTTDDILTAWPESSTLKHLEKCSQFEHCIPHAGIMDEFIGALARLREQHKRTQIDDLLEKARNSGLSENEKVELQGLLTGLNSNRLANEPIADK